MSRPQFAQPLIGRRRLESAKAYPPWPSGATPPSAAVPGPHGCSFRALRT